MPGVFLRLVCVFRQCGEHPACASPVSVHVSLTGRFPAYHLKPTPGLRAVHTGVDAWSSMPAHTGQPIAFAWAPRAAIESDI